MSTRGTGGAVGPVPAVTSPLVPSGEIPVACRGISLPLGKGGTCVNYIPLNVNE